MSDDFDRWLERELSPLLAGTDTPPTPRYLASRPRTARWRLRMASVPALLGSKLLVGAGAVALAAAGVGIKTAVTGSVNPLDWSHGAVTVVQGCMASASPGGGLGGCVSTAEAAGHPDATAHDGSVSPPPAMGHSSAVPFGPVDHSPHGGAGAPSGTPPRPAHHGPATPSPASGQGGAGAHGSSGSGRSTSPTASATSATHH